VSWPGIERALVTYLTAEHGVRVVTELPADLADVAPLIQVVRIGGPSDDEDPRVQIPTVSIDYFAADRGAATDLAEAVDLSIRRLAGTVLAGAAMGKVRTLTGPSWRPWDDLTVRRFGATYQLWLKALTA